MKPAFRDPYLWLHLAGAATLPLWLIALLVALSMGNPVLPPALEVVLIATIGGGPVFWMQVARPFYIYSLVFLALKPTCLTIEQRQQLHLMLQKSRFSLTSLTFSLLVGLLWWEAQVAPVITPFALPDRRWLGIGAACVAFFGLNLFSQVPVWVVAALMAGDHDLDRPPLAIAQVDRAFLRVGIPVQRLLPQLVFAPPLSSAHSPPHSFAQADATQADATRLDATSPASKLDSAASNESDSAARVDGPVT